MEYSLDRTGSNKKFVIDGLCVYGVPDRIRFDQSDHNLIGQPDTSAFDPNLNFLDQVVSGYLLTPMIDYQNGLELELEWTGIEMGNENQKKLFTLTV